MWKEESITPFIEEPEASEHIENEGSNYRRDCKWKEDSDNVSTAS